jgi:hypothetical protein
VSLLLVGRERMCADERWRISSAFFGYVEFSRSVKLSISMLLPRIWTLGTVVSGSINPHLFLTTKCGTCSQAITYELLSHIIKRSSSIVSLFKELENIRIDA